MGCRSNAIGVRVGVNKNWSNRWLNHTGKDFGQAIALDSKIRKYLYKKLNDAVVESISIERFTEKNSFDKEKFAKKVAVGFEPMVEGQPIPKAPRQLKEELIIYAYVGQIGMITNEVKEEITKAIQKMVKPTTKVVFEPVLYVNTNWSARALARRIADQIANRVPFRIAQLNAIKDAMNSKVLGIKTHLSGRLGGVEMARVDHQSRGFIPISTIRCDLDYGYETSKTTMGIIGVKVWINRGEIVYKKEKNGKPIDKLNQQITPVKYTASEKKNKYNNN